MKLKQLEYQLSSIEPFKNPKIVLEQYVTPAHIAACMLDHIQVSIKGRMGFKLGNSIQFQSKYEDITGKIVADLGCGAGCLTIGTAILDAAEVHGFEIDSDALEVFQENLDEFELPQIKSLQCDVREIPSRFFEF